MVQESAVMVREDAPGDRRLVAYVRTASASFGPLVSELRSLLKERLPTYMVPSAFVFLHAFPLTPSGKLDRAALPPPKPRSSDFEDLRSYMPPQTPTEEMLTDIWREFFSPQLVGVRDNFFELGGDLLMIIQMILRINQVLSVDLDISELIQNPTVEKLAATIVGQGRTSKRRPGVFQLQQGRAEIPLYFTYAGPDEFRVANSMGDSHPIFGI